MQEPVSKTRACLQHQKLPLQRVVVPVRLDWGKGTAGNSHLPEANFSLQTHAAGCKRYTVSAKPFSSLGPKIEDRYPEKIVSLPAPSRRPAMVGRAGFTTTRTAMPNSPRANVDFQLADRRKIAAHPPSAQIR